MRFTPKPPTHGQPRAFRAWPCVLLFIALVSPPARALEADELLLITNANVPASRTLAEMYAKQRQVPDHRILELKLPTSEEIPAEMYDREIAPAVRAFLRENGLEKKVTCLVTFYGVPIRIGNRVNSQADQVELAAVQDRLKALPEQIEPLVAAAEKMALEASPDFRPLVGADLDAQIRRAENALSHIGTALEKNKDPDASAALKIKAEAVLDPIVGRMGVVQRLLASAASRSTPPPASQPVEEYVRFRRDLGALQERSFDAEARKQVLQLIHDNLGPFEYARALKQNVDALQTDMTSSALDSELSLLWWQYPRARWIANPLHFANHNPHKALMVSRLDGPQSGIVSQIISTSFQAEKEGLKGKIVIDSRGLPVTDKNGKVDSYGQYDQGLRDLAELLQTKGRGKLSIVFDDRPEVLSPHSAKGVAVYMGWYSVDKYVPACDFVPGAVGFHLASYTMITLRREDPRCWVRNLLDDGIAGTLGAVEEPFLQSFPPADEFFPLLLTGKLSLAEVYWKTLPWSSWRLSLIGDPLYTPYKVNPALDPADLPERLRAALPGAPAGAQ